MLLKLLKKSIYVFYDRILVDLLVEKLLLGVVLFLPQKLYFLNMENQLKTWDLPFKYYFHIWSTSHFLVYTSPLFYFSSVHNLRLHYLGVWKCWILGCKAHSRERWQSCSSEWHNWSGDEPSWYWYNCTDWSQRDNWKAY